MITETSLTREGPKSYKGTGTPPTFQNRSTLYVSGILLLSPIFVLVLYYFLVGFLVLGTEVAVQMSQTLETFTVLSVRQEIISQVKISCCYIFRG